MSYRFVILRHDHPYLHWDLLLEEDTSCRCWRLLREPCSGEPIAAERLPPHRLQYLDYEGPVTGNRGNVRRIVSGSYFVGESAEEELHIGLTHNTVFSSGRLRILNDDRQFWTFDSV